MKIQVHRNDREFIDVIKPNMHDGPWIAGGAVLQWINKMPVGLSDIDVFCRNPEQALGVTSRLSEFEYHITHQTPNAATFKAMPTPSRIRYNQTVQVIQCKYFDTPNDIIDAFDFSVVQLVTDGKTLLCGDNTLRDIRQKTLRAASFKKETFLKRLTKYVTYGYTPLDDTLDMLNEDLTTDFTGMTEYDAAF